MVSCGGLVDNTVDVLGDGRKNVIVSFKGYLDSTILAYSGPSRKILSPPGSMKPGRTID
jgi:hypothetical protein